MPTDPLPPDDGTPDDELTPPAYNRPRGSDAVWTIEMMASRVRSFLRDVETENHLDLGEVKYSWKQIYDGCEAAFEDWNSTPPISSLGLDSQNKLQFDVRTYGMLVRKAVIWLLEQSVPVEIRNQIQYSDQGFSVSEHDKAQLLMQVASQMEQDYDLKKRRFKTAVNMEAPWGGVRHNTSSDPYGSRENVAGELGR